MCVRMVSMCVWMLCMFVKMCLCVRMVCTVGAKKKFPYIT